MDGHGSYSVPTLNRRLETASLDRSTGSMPTTSHQAAPVDNGEPLQIRRLSIMEGRYKVVVSQYPNMVEMLVESKQSGDVFGKEISTSTLSTPGNEGMFHEPRQIYEFMLQALLVAAPPPSGLGSLEPRTSASEEAAAGGLTCFLWEGSKSAYLRVTMKPQYAFMKPVVVSIELPMVAHATTQQKFAIHLQSHAQMSQQLLTEQMVSFGREVDQQRAQFESHVAEKIEQQRKLMLEQTAQFEKKWQSSERHVEERIDRQQEKNEAHKAALTAEMEQLRERLADSLAQSVGSIRDEFQRQLQTVVDAVARSPGQLEKGVYYVMAKGTAEEPGVRGSLAMGGAGMLMGSPSGRSSMLGSPGRALSGRKSVGPAKNTVTAFRVWTSGSLTEDELWHLFNSEFTGRRRAASGSGNMIPSSKRVAIEQETESHVEDFTSSGKYGKIRISAGSITASGQLLCEFIFP
eukprot:jgi/Tetstr1/436895/TSEL_025669.t1